MNILWTYIWLISYDPNYNWGGSSVHPPFLKDVFSQSVSPSTKIASSSDSASWVPWRMSISSSLPRSITTVWGSGSAAWTGDGLGFLFGRFFASGWVFLRFLRVPKNSGFGGSCRGSSIVSPELESSGGCPLPIQTLPSVLENRPKIWRIGFAFSSQILNHFFVMLVNLSFEERAECFKTFGVHSLWYSLDWMWEVLHCS